MSTLASTTSRPPAREAHTSPHPGAAIRSLLMLLWLEIKRSQGYWLLPLMIGLGIYVPGIAHSPDIVLWPEMSLATLQSYVIVAPLAAALAAWLVDRDRRRRTRNLVESVPRSGFTRDMLVLGTASFWGLLGYLGVALWFCGQAVFKATWGGPDIDLMLTGALAVITFAAVGVLVGRLVPNKYSPLLALGVTFFLTIGTDLFKVSVGDGGFRNPIQLLMPYGLTRQSESNVFHRTRHDYVTEVVLWMLALIILIAAVLAVMRHRGPFTLGPLAGMVVVAGFAASQVVNPVWWWGPDSWTPIAYTPSCTTEGEFEICVHPAYEAGLDATASRIVSVMAPIQGLAGVPFHWEQVDPTGRASERPGAINDVGYSYEMVNAIAGIFPHIEEGNHFGQRPASQLVIMDWLLNQSKLGIEGAGWFGWPSEIAVHQQNYGNGMSGVGPDEAELAAFQPQMDAALARFSALTTEQQRAWLEANWEALRAGELTLEDLP